jgi:hypothetical protein
MAQLLLEEEEEAQAKIKTKKDGAQKKKGRKK